jgi:pimeloyl-ACP methyl ester carboxylesterase
MQTTRDIAPSVLPLPHVEGVEHHFAEIRGNRIHYAEAGSGPPLVLQHGWPQHWWSWRHVIAPLAEHYRVICPDIRGMGWSRGGHGPFGWDDLSDDLIALFDALDLERVRLVGHDWGLLAGYRTAVRRPERLVRFAALSGIHPWQKSETTWRSWAAPIHIWAIAALGPAGVTRLGLGEWALRRWRHRGVFSEDETAIYMGPLRRPAAVGATVRFDRNVPLELRRGLHEYRTWRNRVPTLHVNGSEDPLTPEHPLGFEPYADDMRLQVIPGCGHFIAEEAPDTLVELLLDFMEPDQEERA